MRPVKKNHGGRPPIYPWDRWFKKKRLILRRGVHFQCKMHGMAQRIRNQAGRNGLSVSIRYTEDCLVITTRKNGRT